MISVRFVFTILPIIVPCASLCTHTECFDSPGSFSSPGYPNIEVYWTFRDMTWLITAPPGNVINVYVNNFHIGPHFFLDYMRIYDGASKSSRSILYFREIAGPGNVSSSSNNLLVRFHSSWDYIQPAEFSVTFTFECKHSFINS